MPDKKGRFTAQERTFIEAYAGSNNRDYAARKAAYKAPAVAAHQNMNKPAIVAEIHKAQMARLQGELVPLALDHFAKVLAPGSDASIRDKTMVATVVVKEARSAGLDGASTKQLHEMTAEEIAQLLSDLKREAAERARPVMEAEALPEGGIFD